MRKYHTNLIKFERASSQHVTERAATQYATMRSDKRMRQHRIDSQRVVREARRSGDDYKEMRLLNQRDASVGAPDGEEDTVNISISGEKTNGDDTREKIEK